MMGDDYIVELKQAGVGLVEGYRVWFLGGHQSIYRPAQSLWARW
jgi:hypothetical protein